MPDDSNQLTLLGTEQPPEATLSALIQRARVEAATAASGGAVGALVARLAQSDGAAAVSALRAEGFPEATITAAVEPQGSDGRSRPRVRLGIVGGEPMCWLSSGGWSSAGFPSRRERHPSAETAEHAAAPAHLRRWLLEALQEWPALRAHVVTGAACKDFSETVKAAAWASIQRKTSDEAAGALTTGLIPDALIVEALGTSYAGAWGAEPVGLAAVEQTCAVEFEHSRKADRPLRAKVARWDAALSLGAAHAVIWVVQSAEVAERLTALGVGSRTADAPQLLVPAKALGLPGDAFEPSTPLWWPLRIGGTSAG